MKAFLMATATFFAVAAPLSSVYAQASENRPSSAMDKNGKQTGRDLKAPQSNGGNGASSGPGMGTTATQSGSGTGGTTNGGMGTGGIVGSGPAGGGAAAGGE